MQKTRTALLLVGSPKGSNSTSNSLGTYLLYLLEEKGLTTRKEMINQSLCSPEKQAAMLEAVDDSDLIILASPLYVDSLHSQMIKSLELIAQHEKSKPNKTQKTIAAISNCGFPEASQNNVALTVCRIFASQVGFVWAGGLAMGGGGMIHGVPLHKAGGQARNQIKALKLAADALEKGESIPNEALLSMAKLGIPQSLYTWMGNRGWKQRAKPNIKIKQMYDQPAK
jgi:multimeric flavodoxin WrbA